MSESIHDWAVKLGMIRDEASFSATEKFMEDFTQSMVKKEDRVKQAALDRANAEKQARLMAEGEKIRQANLSPADAFEEKKVHLGELYVSGAVGVETFTAAMVKLNAEQEKVLGGAERLKAEGLFDQETRKLLQEKYQYEETQAKRSAARISGYNRQQRQDAAREAAEALRIASVNSKAQLQIDGAFEQETRRLRMEQDAYNEEVAEANRLLNRYGNLAVQAATDIQRLNAMLAVGTITADEHGIAVTEATRRMNSMRGGAGNMGFAMGELARGAEDFITVMSITGFNIESVGMAMRGAGNNISQAVNLIRGPLAGAAVGVGAIVGGQLVSALFRGTAAIDTYSDSLERAIRSTSELYDAEERRLKNKSRLTEIKMIDTPQDLKSQIKTDREEVEKLNNDHARAMNNVAQNARIVAEKMLPQTLSDKYSNLFKTIYEKDPVIAKGLNEKFKDINYRLIETMKNVGPENAVPAFEAQMKTFNSVLSKIAISQDLAPAAFAFTGPTSIWDAESVNNAQELTESVEKMKTYADEYTTLAKEALDIEQAREDATTALAASIARQAAVEKTFRMQTLQLTADDLALTLARSEAEKRELTFWQNYNKLKAENKGMGAFGVGLAMEQATAMQKLQDAKFNEEERKRQEAERIALDDAYEKMKLKSQELLMVSKLTEQEKLTYEYAKRRAEIMESGAGTPDQLEAIFRNEMMAKKNDFETEWKKSAAPMSIDAVSANKALGDASKSMMAATGETKDKELIRAMKAVEDAIRNPNRNRGVMLVEVQ